MPVGGAASYVRPVRTDIDRSGRPGLGAMGRRAFLAGAAAAAAVAATSCGSSGDDRESRADRDDDRPRRRSGGLTWKGLNLDTDRELWRSEYVRREIETIRRELHANSVLLLGSDVDRLSDAATAAADEGLHVWLEPRAFDAGAAATLDHTLAVARMAEALRRDHPDVSLSMGVELTIFMAGLLPGDDWSERGEALGRIAPAEYNGALNAFFADAVPRVREVFGGGLTYSSGPWEGVDWSGFDVVGVDLYRDADNAATFVEDVRALHRHGKPVVITEFGCCSFRGAEDMGGMGFTAIDWTADPPVVQEGLVRDEQVQADYIDELLDVFEAERVDGAFVYDLIEPGNPHRPDPRHDLDMAGFGVVKCYPPDHERAYDRTGDFEPKVAFTTIARRFG